MAHRHVRLEGRIATAVAALTVLLLLAGNGAAGSRDAVSAWRVQAQRSDLATRVILPPSASDCGSEPILVSRRVATPPAVDGDIEGVWSRSTPLTVPLTRGRAGRELAAWVTLRSLHTDQYIYFLAQWVGTARAACDGTVHNRFVVHFDIPALEPDSAERMCLVACHTAFADQAGRVEYALAETIPPGRTDPLVVSGGRDRGVWRLEWGRPLVVTNGFDVQFANIDQRYTFFVKLFEWHDGLADPVSDDCVLILEP